MCSCEEPSVIRVVERVARKEHQCCEGEHVIAKGDRYTYISGVWDGVGSDFKQCANCRAIYDAAMSEANECGPCLGGLQAYLEDEYGGSLSRFPQHAQFKDVGWS